MDRGRRHGVDATGAAGVPVSNTWLIHRTQVHQDVRRNLAMGHRHPHNTPREAFREVSFHEGSLHAEGAHEGEEEVHEVAIRLQLEAGEEGLVEDQSRALLHVLVGI